MKWPSPKDTEQKFRHQSKAITLLQIIKKTTGNNPNRDIFNIYAYTKFGEILSIYFEKILTSIKGHNSVTNLQKNEDNNSYLDLVNINAYTKFGQILFICSKDIERKQNSDINQGSLLCFKFVKNDR